MSVDVSALLLVVRASVVLGVALVAHHASRRRSAAFRHLILSAGVAACLLIVPLGRILPTWTIDMPRPDATTDVHGTRPEAAVATTTAPIDLVSGAVLVSEPASNRPRLGRVAVSAVAVIWALGGVAMLIRLALGLRRLSRTKSEAHPVVDPRWQRLLDDVRATLGIARPVTVVAHPAAAVGTWGVFRPTIVVPVEALDWDDARLRVVLCHELAHVRRADWATQLAAEAVRAALWFNPLSSMVCRRLRDDGEHACDDVVLASGVRDDAYASHLLDIARGTAGRSTVLAAAMSMARPSTLEGRITAMLNQRIDRRRPGRLARALTVALALAVAAVAAARVTAQVSGPAPLRGVVYDSSGGVLPGVEMGLTNEQGVKWSSPTDGEGRFEFAPVGAGTYVLDAVLPGLRGLHQTIVLERPKDWNRIITMQVGDLMETIQVTARRPRTPVALPTQSGVVRVGGNIKVPRKTFNVPPIFPEALRAAGLEGVVKLEVLIDTEGAVTSIRTVNSDAHPDFAAAAATAVRQWRFTPTLLNNKPVEVQMTVSMTFSLSD